MLRGLFFPKIYTLFTFFFPARLKNGAKGAIIILLPYKGSDPIG